MATLETAAAPAAHDPAAILRLLQEVAVAANEAASTEEALGTALAAVCRLTGWPVGHAYLSGEGGQQVPTHTWHRGCDSPGACQSFVEATEAAPIPAGTGLVGRVAATGEPEWVEDVSVDPGFLRAPAAAECGLRAGFAFPLRVGRETVGVLEFYAYHPAAPDPELLEAMDQVGTQLGRVVERTRAQEALRLSEARFAGIIGISADAVVSVDEAQRITLFNRGAEAVFGYAAAEVLGRPLDVLLPERHREGHAAHVHGFGRGPVAARHMRERGQIWGRRRNGETFPAEASISRLEVGGSITYTAVLRDVTARVRAEEALARQAEELRRSNADLEQFASVASHDLQEPLRMVASYTQLLARRYRGRLDADADEFIGYAVEGVTRMQELIDDLLAYARVGRGGGEPGPVSLEAVLERTRALLAPVIAEAGAVVESDGLPVVLADAPQVGQLLQNLVANAVKFRRPEEAPRVRLSARRVGAEWEVCVRDNGIGIDPRFADRIFAVFQRLHGRGEYPGTGIGLAICKKVVERHGGRIWLESGPGQGAVFFFTLPAADLAEEAAP